MAAIEDPSFSATQQNDPRNYAISETHLFSPNLINLAIFTVNRQIEASLPPSQQYTQTTFQDGSLSTWGPDTFITKYVETYYDPSDKVTWTKGRHLFRHGSGISLWPGQWIWGYQRRSQRRVCLQCKYGSSAGHPLHQRRTPNCRGLSQPNWPRQHDGGNPYHLLSCHHAARLWGRPVEGARSGDFVSGVSRAISRTIFASRQVSPLTSACVTNILPFPYEIRNRLGGIVDEGALYGQFVLNPNPLYSPQKANFAPRVGVAYRPTNKTVVRGGFAIFTNSIPTVYTDQAAVNLPMASFSSLNNPPYSLTPLPVTLPAVTSTTGVVMPPNGNHPADSGSNAYQPGPHRSRDWVNHW